MDEQDLGDIFEKSPLSDYFSSLLFLVYLPSNSRSLDSEPYLDIEYIVKWLYDINYAIAIASLSVTDIHGKRQELSISPS